MKTQAKNNFSLLHEQWIDMQVFVQENTPKDATLLVPHNFPIGGFRIHSERSIVCSDRDRNIIAFDFRAAREWEQRQKDIAAFTLVGQANANSAIIAAIKKYQARYIVFTVSHAPRSNERMEFLYGNKYFALYKVNLERESGSQPFAKKSI